MVGRITNTEITKSSASGNVIGHGDGVGGLVGEATGGSISGSSATGHVKGDDEVGGLIGRIEGSKITESYALGDVAGDDEIGGLIGKISGDTSTVTSSYALGNVIGEDNIGGLVGENDEGVIATSLATGNVSGCEQDIGGLVGDHDKGNIINSFATGNVTGLACESTIQSDSIGGLVGDNKGGEIENSYAIGLVSGGVKVGGLVGDNGTVGGENEGTILNSYYDKETTGQSDNKGTGLSSEAMKNEEDYTDWDDFDTIWGIDKHHHGYPYLKDTQNPLVFLTYVGNGSDKESEHYIGELYPSGSSVTVQEKPSDWTKSGYYFHEWNTAADGSGQSYQIDQEIQLTSSLLLYASWNVPVITTPVNGEWTNNDTPDIRGTAEGGSELAIVLNDDVVAAVEAAGDGSWSWTPTTALDEGLHTASVGVMDTTTGNPIRLPREYEFTVDTKPPVITLLGDASITMTAGTTFDDPGVDVTDLDQEVSVTVTGEVYAEVLGTYTLQYDAEDRAGNIAESVTRTVQVNERSTNTRPSRNWILQSMNADLAQLIVSADDEELMLSPKFAANTTSYEVETSAAEVTIEAIPDDTKATVFLGEDALDERDTVVLAEGDNVFEMVVKAEGGAFKTYTVTIQRLVEIVDPTPPEPEKSSCLFRDIQGHWAEQFICDGLEIGIVAGLSETMFQPQRDVTRVEFAAILLRTLGITLTTPLDESSFIDQDQIPAWAMSTVNAAVENGILHGYPDRSLRPMNSVSRAEMVVMMARAMKWETEQGNTTFVDDSAIPNWAKDSVREALQRDLVSGRDGHRFSPHEPASRAEATSLLLRLWYALDDSPSESRD